MGKKIFQNSYHESSAQGSCFLPKKEIYISTHLPYNPHELPKTLLFMNSFVENMTISHNKEKS